MNHSVTIEELKKIAALQGVPDEDLQWILDHTDYHEYQNGTLVYKKGDTINSMWFLLEGSLSFYMDINGQLVYYFNFGNDPLTGGVSGLLPYSRMKTTPGSSYAVGTLRALSLHKKYFPELEKRNPDLIQRLIGYMTERARAFATTQLQHEKVSALGKLAAGIAHELNNPAAAINRISTELNKRLHNNFKLTETLFHHNISPELIKNIQEIVKNKESNGSPKQKLSALQRIEKEDEINEWLFKNGFSENHLVAEIFSESDFTLKELENILENVGRTAFIDVLYWLENILSSERIIKDLEDASNRISKLVGAIKGHVHMDRSSDLHYTGIHNDIENTLTLLGHKIRDKNITVKKSFCADMPEVEAYVGELNQVWTNIIDNAIFALPQKGELQIETNCYRNNVVIKIRDNGSGIPKEIISRIFDPFFTTKKMGEGTGIGLDIVQRVVKQHKGDIKVKSEPGKTEFEILLPVSQQAINEQVKK